MLTPEIKAKIKTIIDAVKRENEGKKLTKEQVAALAALGPSRSGKSRIGFPVIEGIAATASIIGAPERLLKAAKTSGCKAFLTGNRVDVGLLLPFLFAMLAKGSELPPGIASPQDWLTTEKARMAEIDRKKKQGLMMLVSDAKREAGEAVGYMFAELDRWGREMPPSLAGMTAVEVGKVMAARLENIRNNLREKFDQIGETKK